MPGPNIRQRELVETVRRPKPSDKAVETRYIVLRFTEWPLNSEIAVKPPNVKPQRRAD